MRRSIFALGLALSLALPVVPVKAADHGDAPGIAHDRGADLGDCFLFRDPNDNSRLVIGMTTQGFIVSGEMVNFGIFDPLLRYRFEIENTGDFRPDRTIDVRFSERLRTFEAQTATITLNNRRRDSFTARATNPSLAPTANAQVVTDDPLTGISFFAGPVDDPFFFDIPAFARFNASVAAGSPNPAVFDRGRDSFAGYNVMAIALRFPISLVQGNSNIIGLECQTDRQTQRQTDEGIARGSGAFRQADRAGNPAVNVALIPFPRKNAHNGADTSDDARGEFDADITGTLNALGTDPATQDAILNIVARNGDLLRLDLSIPNTGPMGGTNPEAGFPNGRRLGDDTVDVLLGLVSNGALVNGDNADASDVPPNDVFPFFALPQQPRDPGVIDDNTRN
ncbi:MAG: DUF4331 family protein [Candidatus Binatia bacterium]